MDLGGRRDADSGGSNTEGLSRRYLAGMDYSKSTIDVSASVETSSEVVVTVTAFDSAGQRVKTGGQKVKLKVSNECALDAQKE